MKIGIFGGSFDPVHIGHLVMADQAREALGLDEVWFVPASSPPHKSGGTKASPEHRVAMVERAIDGFSPFRLSRAEIERPGLSYTADTVQTFTERYPDDRFYLIVGADMVLDLPRWHRIEQIVKSVRVVGLMRPGVSLEDEGLPDWLRDRLILVTEGAKVELSSTYIRNKAAAGESIRFLVPEPVRLYMKEHRIYESR
ncbi:nicotinate-nucleotide adenylyltransferase [Paludifilum halophilum]|uniref:Probable nicotinate-nucleotide adenylyltransferase n=1 Tax=Paludifilum halophilum TaxID=1642702 RepID=A0A235B7P6_9BACL|nr:nicotinate-nucleotide adenylyltransferase [Paludifilum halophilum]OYD07615.1 hypothetical protein CHM34_09035 [Paludifilum halophilum]